MQCSNKTAVIVCHDAMFGPPHELRDYLLSHGIKKLVFIGHPNKSLPENDITSSYVVFYSQGRKVKEYVSPVVRLPEFLGYVKDTLLTLYWSLSYIPGGSDYFIGLGNLNALAGLLLRSVHATRRTYYYVIDYIPNRFNNTIINTFYHWIDRICARFADTTWNYAQKMIDAREAKWKMKFKKQLVVPNGVHIRKEILKPFTAVHKTELVYLGSLHAQQGLQLVIDALPYIRNKIPGISLSIIGKGPYRKHLEQLASSLRIGDCVHFIGYIKDPVEADDRVSRSALAVAMYKPKGAFVIYTEPGKVKRYLANGVPVIMTDVSPLAKDITLCRCGFTCSYNRTVFAHAVIKFLTDRNAMKRYRQHAVRFASNFTWETIFTSAFLRSS